MTRSVSMARYLLYGVAVLGLVGTGGAGRPAQAAGAGSRWTKTTVRLRTVVPPRGGPLNPRAATAAGTGRIWVATAEDDLVRWIELSTGETGVLRLPSLCGLAAGPSGIWAALDGRMEVVRLDSRGKELQRLRTPFVPTDVAVLPDGTLYASGPRRGTSGVLWRWDGQHWEELPVELEVQGDDPATRLLLATLRLSGAGTGVALVFPLVRSELAVVSPDGRVLWKVLPYFAGRWAALGERPVSVVDPSMVSAIPKPYADVLLRGDTVYCLSFQEGPWKGARATKRGRHLVMVDLRGGRTRVAELPIDGCQLVEAGGRVLVVDRELGVWAIREEGTR